MIEELKQLSVLLESTDYTYDKIAMVLDPLLAKLDVYNSGVFYIEVDIEDDFDNRIKWSLKYAQDRRLDLQFFDPPSVETFQKNAEHCLSVENSARIRGELIYLGILRRSGWDTPTVIIQASETLNDLGMPILGIISQ